MSRSDVDGCEVKNAESESASPMEGKDGVQYPMNGKAVDGSINTSREPCRQQSSREISWSTRS